MLQHQLNEPCRYSLFQDGRADASIPSSYCAPCFFPRGLGRLINSCTQTGTHETGTHTIQAKHRLIASPTEYVPRRLLVPDQYRRFRLVALAVIVRTCQADQHGGIRRALSACLESTIAALELPRHERPLIFFFGSQRVSTPLHRLRSS